MMNVNLMTKHYVSRQEVNFFALKTGSDVGAQNEESFPITLSQRTGARP